MDKQTREDRDILDVHGHPKGPQYIGPRAVECEHYDEHRYEFYRDGEGRWTCPIDEERRQERERMFIAQTTSLKYRITGLGKTEQDAVTAIFREYRRTNNSGYGWAVPGKWGETIRELRGDIQVLKVAPGEAVTE